MITRREALKMLMASSAFAPVVSARASNDYETAVRHTWRHTEGPLTEASEWQRELVRYATLAANSHNTQPWNFELSKDVILIHPDATRRCPVVDPDDHHVWVSLGCAAENLVHAAAAFGRHSEVSVTDDAIRVALTPTTARRSELFDAIPKRQTTRAEYDGRSLPADTLRQLEQAAAFPGVRAEFLSDRSRIETTLEYVTQANGAQIHDDAFVAELKRWIRFSKAEAVAAGDGLFAGSTGNPAMPRWISSSLFSLFFTAKAENEKLAKQVRSSAGAVVFVGAGEHPKHWVDVGRAYQRFALQATALGIRNAFLNQPVEVSMVRGQFARWLNLNGARPDLLVRFGHGPTLPRSLRRPVSAVIL